MKSPRCQTSSSSPTRPFQFWISATSWAAMSGKGRRSILRTRGSPKWVSLVKKIIDGTWGRSVGRQDVCGPSKRSRFPSFFRRYSGNCVIRDRRRPPCFNSLGCCAVCVIPPIARYRRQDSRAEEGNQDFSGNGGGENVGRFRYVRSTFGEDQIGGEWRRSRWKRRRLTAHQGWVLLRAGRYKT